jgi:hypothetical protein
MSSQGLFTQRTDECGNCEYCICPPPPTYDDEESAEILTRNYPASWLALKEVEWTLTMKWIVLTEFDAAYPNAFGMYMPRSCPSLSIARDVLGA